MLTHRLSVRLSFQGAEVSAAPMFLVAGEDDALAGQVAEVNLTRTVDDAAVLNVFSTADGAVSKSCTVGELRAWLLSRQEGK